MAIKLAVTDKQDGTGVSYTITDSDAGAVNTVRYFPDATDATVVIGNQQTGNGTGVIGITLMGTYWFYVRSVATNDDVSLSDNLVRVDVTDNTDIAVSAEYNYIARFGENTDITIQTRSLTVNAGGDRTPTWATGNTMRGWKQDIGSSLREQYLARDLVVTHKVFVPEDPGATEGDRLVIGSSKFLIQGVINQAGLGKLWRLDVEEVK